MNNATDSSQQRLQKYLARCGVASRRACEALITSGQVQVNGETVTELGTKVDPSCDVVCVDGKQVVAPDSTTTLMLNKPAGYVTTMTDPQGRPCVASLVPTDQFPGLFPVGRLDCDTTGLLLFTTDGELGQLLLHPRHHVEKRYLAYVENVPTEADLQRLREGIELDDGVTLPARVRLLEGQEKQTAYESFSFDEENASGHKLYGKARHGSRGSRNRGTSLIEVCIREGRKRQVRRMLGAIHCPVIALHRVQLGPLDLGDLPRGSWHVLDAAQIQALRSAAQ